ncbi:hypothetical protein M472_16255 [Sphingobacterium paucimobilis HER1398]|uniref:MBG domain-containing protein n=2 Tax=Sphingobacterium TaxID=28453 RepID=U2H818_9SPHI|nr:hypothetical protein M472_03685 [Sphingobacterium paucimobilis HER1398]ERJ60312.1 hypothetical protein M472_16255 [Sphingobacterium paucimobilis HER1398]
MNVNATRGDAALFSTAVDASGNVYVVGQFEGTNVDFDPGSGAYLMSSTGGQDIFVQKLDANGNFLWARRYGSATDDVAYGIALDNMANVYLTGRFTQTVEFDPSTVLTSKGAADGFVLKLSTEGDFIWAKQMGGTGFDIANGIAVDVDGDVYTTGSFVGTADFDPGSGVYNLVGQGSTTDIFVQKLDRDGNFVWAIGMGGPTNDVGYSLGVDAAKNVYVTGNFTGIATFGNVTLNAGTTGARDIFVTKINANGTVSWAKSMGLPAPHDDSFGLAVDPTGNVYVTGGFRGNNAPFGPSIKLTSISAGVHDVFVQKLNTNGTVLWAKNIGGAAADSGYSIALDGEGNVYTTGYFTAGADIDFDPGEGNFPLVSNGLTDAFVLVLNNDGNFVWAKSMGGAGSDAGHSVTVDKLGNVYTAGRFTGTVDFNSNGNAFPLTAGSSTTYAAFIQKLKPVIKITATWNDGTNEIPVEAGDPLELVYGDQGTLTLSHNNLDVPAPVFSFVQDPAVDPLLAVTTPSVGNTYTIKGVRANASGEEGTLKVTLPGTSNLDGAELEFTVVVKKRPITVSSNVLTKSFGTGEPTFNFSVSEGTLNTGHTTTGALTRNAGETMGYYDFHLGSLAVMSGSDNVTSNYVVTIDPAQFQIIGMPLTITATGEVSKLYGANDPAFTYIVSQGSLPSGYSLTGTLERGAGEDVGHYPFMTDALVVKDGNGQDVTSSYTITSDPQVLFSIKPVALTISAVANTKVYGHDDPVFAYTVTGLVHNEDPFSLFSGSLKREPGEDVGEYQIQPYTLSLNSTNYEWNPNDFIEAIFKITKASQVITLSVATQVQLNAGTLPVVATSDSQLPVTLTVDDERLATAVGAELVLLKGGTLTVKASQVGNHNYEAATDVTALVQIIDPKSSPLIVVQQAVSPNGDGVNDFLTIENIERYPENHLTIIDRSGNLIKEITGYDNDQRVFTGMDVPDGTYFYKLKIKISGNWQYYQGFIVVKKN